MNRENRQLGFSLLELLVVMTIVAVLAAVAYPNYQRYVTRTHHIVAQQYLLALSGQQTQRLFENHGYSESPETLGMLVPKRVLSHYTVAIINVDNSASPPTYTLQATPKDQSNQQAVGTLTLNHLGQKSASWHD